MKTFHFYDREYQDLPPLLVPPPTFPYAILLPDDVVSPEEKKELGERFKERLEFWRQHKTW